MLKRENRMIKVYNRQTKDYEIEKVAGNGVLETLYNTRVGEIGLEVFVKRKLYSFISGVICNTNFSARKIKDFAEQYDIDMNMCQNELPDFKSFNDFFTRRLKPGVRVFDPLPGLLPAPGDGRLRAWMDIDINKLVQIKDFTYSLKELLMDDQLANKYQGGICIILRLAPPDYHRFHFIDNGICSKSKKIKGQYYSVNPIALSKIPQVFCRNKREYSILHSENFRDVVFMEVGAAFVGTIVQTYTPGDIVLRGAEKGCFKFGGSTIILFLEKGAASIDNEIIEQTEIGYETRVFAGDVIGRKM
jgi:phosphatidylserine decarboxylase